MQDHTISPRQNAEPGFSLKQTRLLILADYLESIPEHKFDLRTWCQLDHTCKTAACIGGWAVILFGGGRRYLSIAKEQQELIDRETNMGFIRKLLTPNIDGRIAQLEFDRIMNKPDWFTEGMDVLRLKSFETYIFLPLSTFWRNKKGYVSNVDAAAALRYLALNPPSQDDESWIYRPFDGDEIRSFLETSPEMALWRTDHPHNNEPNFYQSMGL